MKSERPGAAEKKDGEIVSARDSEHVKPEGNTYSV
nr:MAG TPA: hypothetical protein [Caudoviricetes sp.]